MKPPAVNSSDVVSVTNAPKENEELGDNEDPAIQTVSGRRQARASRDLGG